MVAVAAELLDWDLEEAMHGVCRSQDGQEMHEKQHIIYYSKS